MNAPDGPAAGRVRLALMVAGPALLAALLAGGPALAQSSAQTGERARVITLQPLNPGAPNGSQINSDSTGKMRELNDPLTRRGADRGTAQEDFERRARLREEARQRELSTVRPTRPAPSGN